MRRLISAASRRVAVRHQHRGGVVEWRARFFAHTTKPVIPQVAAPEYVRQLALNVFKSIDANHDGSLSPSEVSAALKANNFDSGIIDKVMAATDLNHDGLISFDEFFVAMRYLWAPDRKVTSLVHMQQMSCASHAARPLFGTKIDGEYRYMTYEQFGHKVDACRGALGGLGVRKGSTVAIISNNCPEWAITAYATFGLGAKFVPMYEAQLPKDWKYIIEDSECSVLFVANEKILNIVQPWIGSVGRLQHVIAFNTTSQEAAFATHMQRGQEKPASAATVSEHDIACLIYTSGTTGKPKGVLLSHGNLLSNVLAIEPIFPLTEADISLSFLPWAHCFGQTCELHAMIRAGATVAIAESVAQLTTNLAEVQPTMLFSVPQVFTKIHAAVAQKVDKSKLTSTLFHAALNAAEHVAKAAEKGVSPSPLIKLKSSVLDKLVLSKIRLLFGGRMRAAICGGAPLAPSAAQFMENLGIPVYEGYGLSETSPIVACNSPGAHRLGTVGHALPGVKVATWNDLREVLPSNTEGELMVAGPNVMQGYHKNDEATAEVIAKVNGVRWFHTGDLAVIEPSGFIRITGRAKEQYKLENGKYVVPAPVEEAVKLSPYIQQAFLHGIGKAYNIMLCVPNFEFLRAWAKSNNIAATTNTDLLAEPKVKQMLDAELQKQLVPVKKYERPERWLFVAEEWTVENGLCTPKLSMKRNKILEKYAAVIAAMYNKSAL